MTDLRYAIQFLILKDANIDLENQLQIKGT